MMLRLQQHQLRYAAANAPVADEIDKNSEREYAELADNILALLGVMVKTCAEGNGGPGVSVKDAVDQVMEEATLAQDGVVKTRRQGMAAEDVRRKSAGV